MHSIEFEFITNFLYMHGRDPNHPNMLPTVWCDGKRYFVDGRLREWRNVDDPSDIFVF